MKKIILSAALVSLMGSATFAQQNKKAEAARKDLSEAQIDLNHARNDSAADFHAFKKEAQEKISANQKKIAELKTKKINDNKKIKDEYNKKVSALEKKNNDLKRQIEGSDKIKTNMWTEFKRDFYRNMAEIANSFKVIGENSTN